MPESTAVEGAELEVEKRNGAAQLPSALRSVVTMPFSGSPVVIEWVPLKTSCSAPAGAGKSAWL